MELTDFQANIQQMLPSVELKFQEPMAKHTSLRIGGGAQVMAFPKSYSEIQLILSVCRLQQLPFRILGAGTNVLAPDASLPGMVICLKDCLNGITKTDNTHIRAMAGVTMTRLAMFAANQGLSGLEFAHGIPGTIGGGVYMNAGAYGGEIGKVCTRVWVMNFDGKITCMTSEQMQFSYRHSILEEQDGIVLEAEFLLTPDEPEKIKERLHELQKKRSASQPLDYPSAGSAFKRPVGGYAAALIDEAGLKGYQIGGAAISEKHAGFAINLGGSTAEDMKTLLQNVSDIVFAKSGIRLEPEIRIW